MGGGAQMTAVAPNPLAEGLHDYRVGEPCLMVIFGATGDLSGRKLLPALYNLAKQRLLPAGFAVVGAAIDDLTDDAFRKHASEKIAEFSRTQPIDQRVLDAFLRRVLLQQGRLRKARRLQGAAAPPQRAGHDPPRFGQPHVLLRDPAPDATRRSWSSSSRRAWRRARGFHRIVVEKPFGSDLKSARELTAILQRVFHEDSVYRIDHYLGKETVQNIMAFRFANSIFEPVWNTNLIDSVQITVAEEIGVEGRGAYYDKAGALRDIVQNHALAARGARRHGAAACLRGQRGARREGQGPARDPADHGRGGRAFDRARAVHEGMGAGPAGARLSRGEERRTRLADRDVRRAQARDRQLALGERAVLHPRGQAHAEARDGDPHPVQAPAAHDIRPRRDA